MSHTSRSNRAYSGIPTPDSARDLGIMACPTATSCHTRPTCPGSTTWANGTWEQDVVPTEKYGEKHVRQDFTRRVAEREEDLERIARSAVLSACRRLGLSAPSSSELDQLAQEAQYEA